jgi:predicted kinase
MNAGVVALARRVESLPETGEPLQSVEGNLLVLVLTRGLPASGKTMWARWWVAQDLNHRARINRDDLRLLMHDGASYQWPQEQAVTHASHAAVKALLSAGISVVVDDMNLRARYVRTWREIAADHGATVQILDLDVDVEECVRRDNHRNFDGERSVGEQFIRETAAKFYRHGHLVPDENQDVEVVSSDPGLYVPPEFGTATIVVDVDGTLALVNGRGHYDYDKVSTDLPNKPVVRLVQMLARSHRVVYVSGRPDSCYVDTYNWLAEHVSVSGELLMRADGDNRNDAVIKREIFDTSIRPYYDVRFVIDDRNRVVRMWRSLGLTVLQVADGAF